MPRANFPILPGVSANEAFIFRYTSRSDGVRRWKVVPTCCAIDICRPCRGGNSAKPTINNTNKTTSTPPKFVCIYLRKACEACVLCITDWKKKRACEYSCVCVEWFFARSREPMARATPRMQSLRVQMSDEPVELIILLQKRYYPVLLNNCETFTRSLMTRWRLITWGDCELLPDLRWWKIR